MKKPLKLIYNILAFTGLWLFPVLVFITYQVFPEMNVKNVILFCLAVTSWTTFNNIWSVMCEEKQFDKIGIGDGLIPYDGLTKESAQKQSAIYPRVPPDLLSKKPEGIILGTYKNRYVRLPLKNILHTCILGGSGSGKTSTVLLDTLLSDFAAGTDSFQTFAINIKGEPHKTATNEYDPTDRTSTGWDAYYRLRDNPNDDLIIEAMEEIAQALIISGNPKDNFFVENARTMFSVLLIHF